MDVAAAVGRSAGIRRAARIQRERAMLMRYRARRTRRRAEELSDRVYARAVLAALADPDLSVLDDVRPGLRLIQGGRD